MGGTNAEQPIPILKQLCIDYYRAFADNCPELDAWIEHEEFDENTFINSCNDLGYDITAIHIIFAGKSILDQID